MGTRTNTEIEMFTVVLTHWVALAVGAFAGVVITLFMMGRSDNDDNYS